MIKGIVEIEEVTHRKLRMRMSAPPCQATALEAEAAELLRARIDSLATQIAGDGGRVIRHDQGGN
jgi:hypothetical protein